MVPALNYPPDLVRGSTESILLFLIDAQGRTYGYQLIKEIERRSQGFLRFKEGTVYPALRKLENEGLLEGDWQTLPNGQSRRYYHITDKGKQVLDKKMAEWRGFTNAVNLVMQPAKT